MKAILISGVLALGAGFSACSGAKTVESTQDPGAKLASFKIDGMT